MLAIAINYLNGQVKAATYNSSGATVEWPPHPDRVFMALVAAWGETGRDDAGEQALRWLESQSPPPIAAGDCRARHSVRHYVPANDDRPPAQRWRLLPEHRSRQSRQFAAAALDNPVAHIIWPDAEPGDHRAALQRLAAGVTSVGHSSSLTQVWVDAAPPPANWRPSDGPGGYQMRVPYAGRFDDLTTAYARGERPQARRWIGYRKVTAAPDTAYPQSVFSDNLIIFEASGSGLDLRATDQLAAAWRNRIMDKCPDPVPEWVSGHTQDGGRSEKPHIAVIPLPFVGRQHANGRVMGLAMALPRSVPASEARRCLHRLLGYDENGELKSHIIQKGQWNEITLRQPEAGASPPARYNLRAETWTGSSDTWHTVTPATLDRYYKGPDKARLERQNVAEQCVRIGLPPPVAVALGPVSMLEGVAPAREFPRLRRRSDRGGNGEWQHTHATNYIRGAGARAGNHRQRTLPGLWSVPTGTRVRSSGMSIANRPLTGADFGLFFQELWGHEPYDWQQRLAEQVLQSAGEGWPEAIALPTAAGKTACVDIAVFAMAALADTEQETTPHPRRLFYTVDRRNIVDQTYQRAADLRDKLADAQDGILRRVANRLRRLAGGDAPEPLAVYRLRGGIRQSSSWERNPRQPAVITSTVDQVGSALLFRAYGKGRGVWPVHAGLAANDSIIILDEAHCAQPFLQTVRAVRKYRQWGETPQRAPFQAVIMSATPPDEIAPTEIFSDTSSQQGDPGHPLGRRQLAAKPARLAEAKRVPRNGNALAALGRELADAALDLAGAGIPTVVVFANRVATAREAHRIIRERDVADAVLITGRMRQRERERAMCALQRVAPDADPQTRAGARPLIAVATQTLEIGADLDFDGLVTECASLDALRQRFGRLNRAGRDLAAPGRIIIRADQVKDGTPDPIYGDAISATWQWLNEQASAAGEIDFGIASIAALLAGMAADDRERLHPPASNATVMLPAHLDAWAQTGPDPQTGPAPDLDTYLHGKDDRPADVQVCWRAGLDLDDFHQIGEHLQVCPPNSLETLPVPLYAFRRWLAGGAGDDDSGDAPGQEADAALTDGPGQGNRRVIRWRGAETERSGITANPRDIAPGDTVVIPTGHPGDFRRLGDLPDYAPGGTATLDIGDETNCKARGRPTLRISRELLRSWQRVVADAAPETQAAPQVIRDALSEISQPDLTAAERAAAVDGLLERLVDMEMPDGYEWLSQNAGLLRSKARFRVVSYSADALVLQPRHPAPAPAPESCRSGNHRSEHPDDEDDVIHSRRANTVLLTCHSHGVADWAKRYAVGCGIAGPELAAIRCAALLHDIGKADPLFQQAMHGGNPYYDPTRQLAKSPNAANIRVRHELMSVRMAESSPALLPDDPDARDLALHLIASHHGHCRPFAPPRQADLEKRTAEFILDGVAMHGQGPTGLERLDSGVAERYWRLTRKYGWWGLAYLEAIVRVADWSRSQWEETRND